MAKKKKTQPLAGRPNKAICPKCGRRNETSGAKTLQVDLRPVLTKKVFAFPDALAEVSYLECAECSYKICLDYRLELDDNPELDLNTE